MKRRTEITVEEQIRMVCRERLSPQVFCLQCPGEVLMLPPEEAALMAGVSARAIYRLVEEGRLHFRESPHGTLQICPSSLREQLTPG